MAGDLARVPDWAVRALATRQPPPPGDEVGGGSRPANRHQPQHRRGEGEQQEEPLLPVLPALRPLLPGLRRGQTVAVPGGPGAGGSRSGVLPWALAAQACADGSWAAAVGLPETGVLAAADLGVDPDRLVLVDEPRERWADVVSALLSAVDIVVVRPPRRPPPGLVRRLAGLARQHGSVLVGVGGWEGAAVRVQVAEASWVGVGAGHGRLTGRRARVEVSGRGADVRSRSAWLWLPGPDGQVTTVRPDEVPGGLPELSGRRLEAVV